MSNIKQCQFCEHYDKTRQSYYGETYRCTKTHRFVDPNNTCEDFAMSVNIGSELDKLIKEINKQ